MNLLDLFFPKTCLSCRKTGVYLCAKCVDRASGANQICIECEKSSIDGKTDKNCKTRYSLDSVISIWDYHGLIQKSIVLMKFSYAYEIGRELAWYMNQILEKEKRFYLPKVAILVPIPMHKLRFNYRGFNQSAFIGKLIAQKQGWQFVDNLLIKPKSTISQTQFHEKDRAKNIKGAFILNSELSIPNSVPIILFDDVCTTGSTLKEAGRVLKHAGFREVYGLTVAR